MADQTRERFAQHVIELVRSKFPLAKIARAREPFSIRLNGHVASLENLYRSVQLKPDAEDALVKSWAVELLRAAEGLPERTMSFEELSDRIMPIVLSSEAFAANKGLLGQELIDGLAVAYVLDGDRTIVYIPSNQLERWGVDLDTVHEKAIENLATRSETLAADAAQDGEGNISVILFQTGDSYDSSRILLPNLYERLREYLGGPFVAAVPNREILICLKDDGQTLEALRSKVKEDYLTMPHQVSDRLILVTADGLAPYVEEAGS